MNNPHSGYWKTKGEYDPKVGKFTYSEAQPQTVPVFLKICNPLRIVDHGDNHTLYDFITILFNKKMISFEEEKQAFDFPNDKKLKFIIKKMLDAGYDGFVYKNKQEHIGSTSYIILSPKQVKSVFEFFD